MDIALALESLVPAVQYGGSLTANIREAYNALRWEDERPKPTWEEIEAAWTNVASAQLASAIRAERDRLLATTYEPAAAQLARQLRTAAALGQDTAELTTLLSAWDVYAAALCSLPQQAGFPWAGPDDPACPWPEQPAQPPADG